MSQSDRDRQMGYIREFARQLLKDLEENAEVEELHDERAATKVLGEFDGTFPTNREVAGYKSLGSGA